MVYTDKDFKIIPIFNQAAGSLWDDFIRIEITCDKEMFNFNAPKENKYRMLDWYKYNLTSFEHNFAFGAYYRNEIVGFTNGYLDRYYEMYLEHLYVLPKYQKYGIGSRLLKAVEQMSCLLVSKVQLTALSTAVSFYEKNGYVSNVYMEKDLSPIANAVVPVFNWIKKDFNVKFDFLVNSRFLRQYKYQPIFVHTNAFYKIDGVGLKTEDDKNMIWTNKNNSVYCELVDALEKTK